MPKPEADALNHASGEVYSRVVVTHWRAYRLSSKTWLSQHDAMRLSDWQARGADRLLHAHSIDAAQEGFYKAVKTARTNRKGGKVHNAHFPHKRKWYRTTVWKSTGIHHRAGQMLLSRARGLQPVCVDFQGSPGVPHQTEGCVREVRLVFDLKQRGYFWHIVVEDGLTPTPVEGGTTAAIDMGEIHPVAITDGDEACILSCRQLRSVAQGTNRNLANLQSKMSRTTRGSRRFKRLYRAKRRMLARQKRRQRDLLHKVSRATIQWCQEKNVGTLAIGDVRDIADKTKEKKRLDRHNRQKMSHWSHGMLRQYLNYKADEAGISITPIKPPRQSARASHKPNVL